MSKFRKRYLALILSGILITGALVWLRSYVFDKVAVNIHEQIQSLKLSGLNIRYDTIRVDWLSNVIEIDRLVFEQDSYDTTCAYPEHISIGKVRAEGLGLIRLIFKRILTLDALHLDSPRLVMRRNSQLNLDSSGQRKNEFTLEIDRLFLRAVEITYTDSAHCETIANATTHLAATGLTMNFQVDRPLTYGVKSVKLENTEITLPSRYYTFRLRQLEWNLPGNRLRVDSAEVIPSLGRLAFGRRHGFEIDRFEGLISSFRLDGISFSTDNPPEIRVGLAEIQFQLRVLRDKRLPFVRKKKLLPLAQLQHLPFHLTIDSLKVTDSFVQYEEFIDLTDKPGGIFFDQLNAMLRNVSNVYDSGNATLQARARLYGQGDLSLYGTFPFNPALRSSIAGSIRNFSLPKLNPILTPSTQIEVASGNMKELLFEFTYNDTRSDGEIELNYENLKLVSFKDEDKTSGDEPRIDNLQTFIMNAFVFRKHMTDDIPEEKRKGVVGYVRDDAKSVFNFWSKSLVSGIKSAYSIAEPDVKARRSKKEERLSRKEARRQKRAEKKKERG